MDRVSILGLLLGGVALTGTRLLDGGPLSALLQPGAATIVGLGTLGATLLSCGPADLRHAAGALGAVFRSGPDRTTALPRLFRELATIARKDGLVSLEARPRNLPSAFASRALRLVIDGCDGRHLRGILESDARARQRACIAAAEVFETAGGYAPTMGILGAVLGLIRAMESLADPDALGAGIAVAFVATIYGVGAANLVLLPIAAKIRQRARQDELEDEMVIDGTLALQSGLAPRAIERQLLAHLGTEDAA